MYQASDQRVYKCLTTIDFRSNQIVTCVVLKQFLYGSRSQQNLEQKKAHEEEETRASIKTVYHKRLKYETRPRISIEETRVLVRVIELLTMIHMETTDTR